MQTVKQFNSQLTGQIEFAPETSTIAVANGLNRMCPIHLVPMQNIQHPTKPLGVIMAQICPECNKNLNALESPSERRN